MFNQARLKLTTWYLLIIMLVSISFSVVVYEILTSELDRVERAQRSRVEHRLFITPPQLPIIDPEVIEETKNRLIYFLAFINFFIFGSSAVAGYFLAGRTLKPIKDMIDQQSRFVTDASHELRTPITSLKSEIEVNLRDKNLNLSQTKEILKSNLEDVNNLQVLADGLIKLTQYNTDHNNLNITNISLFTLVNKAIKKVAKLAKNKNIKINFDNHDFSFAGESNSLTELLVILLDNAIKYSPKNSQVQVLTEQKNNQIIVQVKDFGAGIDKKDLPFIFDRFYRADKSRTKNQTDGFGLGLSIAKQIVEKHYGTITIDSQLNKGTTVSVFLPQKHTYQTFGLS